MPLSAVGSVRSEKGPSLDIAACGAHLVSANQAATLRQQIPSCDSHQTNFLLGVATLTHLFMDGPLAPPLTTCITGRKCALISIKRGLRVLAIVPLIMDVGRRRKPDTKPWRPIIQFVDAFGIHDRRPGGRQSARFVHVRRPHSGRCGALGERGDASASYIQQAMK
jgi:hypothetical protein